MQVSTVPDFSTLIVYDSLHYNAADLAYYLSDLTGSTTYYWRVNSLNSYGASPWSETWTFTTDTVIEETGIASPFGMDIGIYPNPVGSALRFSGINVFPAKVSIINATGVTVMNALLFDNVLNTQTLKPGVYMFKLETEEGIAVRRFIKL